MKKRLLALLLVFAMLLPVFNVAAFADDSTSTTPEKQYSVTVYFSLTDDGSILNGFIVCSFLIPHRGQVPPVPGSGIPPALFPAPSGLVR